MKFHSRYINIIWFLVSISPPAALAWFRDDQPVETAEPDRYIVNKESLGTCHLDIRRLEFMDQAEWKCVATNDFGHSVTSAFLKLSIPKHFKKPRFLEALRAVLSEEGAVNLECKVIGVPQPILKWYKDGEELKPGDIHRIISGQVHFVYYFGKQCIKYSFIPGWYMLFGNVYL